MLKNKNYLSRLSKIKKSLNAAKCKSALLISSAPHRTYSRDTSYPYNQDRDFFYFTGSEEPELTLLISTELKRPLIFAPKIDKKKLIWDGPRYDLKTALKNTSAELVEYADFSK